MFIKRLNKKENTYIINNIVYSKILSWWKYVITKVTCMLGVNKEQILTQRTLWIFSYINVSPEYSNKKTQWKNNIRKNSFKILVTKIANMLTAQVENFYQWEFSCKHFCLNICGRKFSLFFLLFLGSWIVYSRKCLACSESCWQCAARTIGYENTGSHVSNCSYYKVYLFCLYISTLCFLILKQQKDICCLKFSVALLLWLHELI